jgi:selenophosphate synthetase-related protein
MAGVCGTLLMLIETSGCGAQIDVARVPAPKGVDPLRWLTAFPSFGFLLAVDPERLAPVRARFDAAGIACEAVGKITTSARLDLFYEDEQTTYWDLQARSLTGFGS